MSKYLYGANIQGIQQYIFQTNKLKEIAGGSELIERICKDLFRDICPGFNDNNLQLAAAGQVRYIFDHEIDCRAIVKLFPKQAMELAPGVQLIQAVITMSEDSQDDFTAKLEDKLLVKKNIQTSNLNGFGLMGVEASRRTGGTAVEFKEYEEEKDSIDRSQKAKLEAAKNYNKLFKKLETNESGSGEFPFDMEDIALDEKRNWLAIVHADGNDLGKTIMGLSRRINGNALLGAIKAFSKILDEVTVEATKNAYQHVIVEAFKKENLQIIPFRPVVLGGDDLTAIIRGDLAFPFTQKFIEEFERLSEIKLKAFPYKDEEGNPIVSKLSSCAGIAYIKKNFPFHYGIHMAEILCSEAKKDAKSLNLNPTPSCLMFHKVSASYVEDWEAIVKKELTGDGVSFDYGPYYLEKFENKPTMTELANWVESISKSDAPKAPFRKWLSLMKTDKGKAGQLLTRIGKVHSKYKDFPIPNTLNKGKTPVYDIISLSNLL